MAPLKEKPMTIQPKDIEFAGPSKRVGATKFKIYTENDKAAAQRRANVRCTAVSKPILQKHAAKEPDKKGPISLQKGGRFEKLDSLVKDNAPQRRALADVSNIKGTSSGHEGHSSVKKRYSLTFVRIASSSSSSNSLAMKGRPKVTQDFDGLNVSTKGDTKLVTAPATSNFQEPRGQLYGTMSSRVGANMVQATRNSFPVSRRADQVHSKSIKENAKRVDTSKRIYGFQVKTRSQGKGIPQVSCTKNEIRLSDLSLSEATKGLAGVKCHGRLEKSIKPNLNPTRSSFARRPSKPRSTTKLDHSQQPAMLSRRDTEALTSVPNGNGSSGFYDEPTQREHVNKRNENLITKESDICTQKKSGRRRSYTSLLISRSKLLEDIEDLEQEKLPDIYERDNPLEVAEYIDEIYQYYWAMEGQGMVIANYMTNQSEATTQMRGILINWLIEVHYKFDLMPETLYLTVALLDRYLSLVTVSKNEMQMVGLTSLLLASKYEDFWHPRVEDLISISAESYNRRQVLQMEKDILRKLEFRFNLPTAYVFMLRFLKASQSDTKLQHMAFYLIELSLVEFDALKFKPSSLSAAAIYVARSTLQITPTWTPLLTHHARYEALQIRECAEMILRFHKAATAGPLKVAHEKYTRPEFGEVAAIKPLNRLPSLSSES